MAINSGKQQGGGKIMAIGQTVAGAVTGNPALIATGIASMNPGSPASRAVGLYNTGQDVSEGMGAIQRRLSASQVAPEDHTQIINNGLDALRDMPEEMQNKYAEPLIRGQMMSEQGRTYRRPPSGY